MKYWVKFIFIVIVFVAVSVAFISGKKGNGGNLLTLKNVEALADGETGWEKCVAVRGYCVNSIDGTIYSYLMNTLE